MSQTWTCAALVLAAWHAVKMTHDDRTQPWERVVRYSGNQNQKPGACSPIPEMRSDLGEKPRNFRVVIIIIAHSFWLAMLLVQCTVATFVSTGTIIIQMATSNHAWISHAKAPELNHGWLWAMHHGPWTIFSLHVTCCTFLRPFFLRYVNLILRQCPLNEDGWLSKMSGSGWDTRIAALQERSNLFFSEATSSLKWAPVCAQRSCLSMFRAQRTSSNNAILILLLGFTWPNQAQAPDLKANQLHAIICWPCARACWAN